MSSGRKRVRRFGPANHSHSTRSRGDPKAPKTLKWLPLEIISMIVGHLHDKRDLCSISLACKGLCKHARFFMLERHFDCDILPWAFSRLWPPAPISYEVPTDPSGEQAVLSVLQAHQRSNADNPKAYPLVTVDRPIFFYSPEMIVKGFLRNGQLSPLHAAAASGADMVVQHLLDQGVDVDMCAKGILEWGACPESQLLQHVTPLFMAVTGEKATTIELLLGAGAKVGVSWKAALMMESTATIQAMLKHLPDLAQSPIPTNDTLMPPIMYFIQNGRPNSINRLLSLLMLLMDASKTQSVSVNETDKRVTFKCSVTVIEDGKEWVWDCTKAYVDKDW